MRKLDPEVFERLAGKIADRMESTIHEKTLPETYMRVFCDVFGHYGTGGIGPKDLFFNWNDEHRIQCLLLMAEMVRNP